MIPARDLKFYICIPHEKIINSYFYYQSYSPFQDYSSLITKFENLVCNISQKVFELEPSYLVY